MSTLEPYAIRRGDFWFASLLHNLFLLGIFSILVGMLILQCLPYMNGTQGLPVAIQPDFIDALESRAGSYHVPSEKPHMMARSDRPTTMEVVTDSKRDIWDDVDSILNCSKGSDSPRLTVLDIEGTTFRPTSQQPTSPQQTSQQPSKPSTSASSSSKPESAMTTSNRNSKPTTSSTQTLQVNTTLSAFPKPSTGRPKESASERFPIAVKLWIQDQWKNIGYLNLVQISQNDMDLVVMDADEHKPPKFELNQSQIQYHRSDESDAKGTKEDTLYTLDFEHANSKSIEYPKQYHPLGMKTSSFEDKFYLDRNFKVGQLEYYGDHPFASFAICNTGNLTLFWRDTSTAADGSLWCKDVKLFAGKE